MRGEEGGGGGRGARVVPARLDPVDMKETSMSGLQLTTRG